MSKIDLVYHRFDRVNGRVFEDSPAVFVVQDVLDKDSQLLDYIFSIDPKTGIPRGDVAQYLGESTNSEVKAFIEMNLMKDNVQQTSQVSVSTDLINKMREVITDDDIAYFSRNDGETSEQYAERMHNYFAEVRYKNALKKQNSEIQTFIKKALKDEK